MVVRFILVCVLLAVGCDRPSFNAGAMCQLNTDCAAPFVCQLDRCRRQCVDSRDCGAGLRCLALEGETGGACQLPEETGCALSSECPTGLVCSFGTCTTQCASNRDCASGAVCSRPDAGASDGGPAACMEAFTALCIYNSDCPEPQVCGADQLCRLECVVDRDCTPPRICLANRCTLYDAGP
jgi:hypothetical protein